MKIFQAPAILNRISYLKDGGISLGFGTNELDDREKLLAGTFYGKFGYVLFKENSFTEDTIPSSDAERPTKSLSTRLRSSLFVLWKQKYTDKYLNFDSFYSSNMEKIIDAVKEKLE